LRLTLLTEIPAPYRIPLFNALAGQVELTVLFLRERNPERPYRLHEDELGFRRRVVPGFDVTVGRRWLVVNRGVLRELRESEPDAVLVGGWNQPAFLSALLWARAHGKRTLLWVESTLRDRRGRRLEPLKRWLLAHGVDRFVVPGRASQAYLRALGVRGERIAVAPNAVDPAIFGGVAPALPAPERCRVLGVGRLSPEKGFDLLLRAVDGLPVDVVLAGSGPEEARLRALGGANVRFLGQVERDALPGIYADADVLVAPSRSEPWGMALNEAALAGLPLVATDAVGSAHDLIEDGVNGFRLADPDVGALRDAIERLCGDPELRAAAGRRSREIGRRFTPDAWAAAVAAAAAR
jgi:glycosyltransferase involved in cell wall biosynthesis